MNVLLTLFLFDAAASPAGNPLVGFLPILLIFGIFYFLLFLPMQKQRKNTQKMLASLQTGQVVVTSGGIVGTVVAIEADDTLVLAREAGQREDPSGAQRRFQPVLGRRQEVDVPNYYLASA